MATRSTTFRTAATAGLGLILAIAMPTLAAAEREASSPSPESAARAMGVAYDGAVRALILGDEVRAGRLYREAITHAERGDIRDARYALSCVELAMLRARIGDTDEAVSLMARAHAARRALLGPDHPDVIETRLMLRELRRQHQRLADAGRPGVRTR